jgi:hypothetical protein
MSLLPLGNSSADQPAHAHQRRHGGQNPVSRISKSGCFKTYRGPYGGCPVQFEGTLQNGEYVYFRARGKRVELTVSPNKDANAHATYKKELLITNHELGCGVLPEEICEDFICRWVGDYLSRCSSSQSRYAGAAYVVEEPSESKEI